MTNLERGNRTIETMELEKFDFSCDICERAFDNENSLRMHKLRSHKLSPIPLRNRRGEAPKPVYEKPVVTTDRDELISFLEDIKFRNIPTVLRFADESGYDLRGVYYALKKADASKTFWIW